MSYESSILDPDSGLNGRRRKLIPRTGMRNMAALVCFMVTSLLVLLAVLRLVSLSLALWMINTLERKTMLRMMMMMTGTPRNQLLSPRSIQQW